MKPLKLFRIIAVLLGIMPIFFGFAPDACADLAQTLAEEKALKAKISELVTKVIIQRDRVERHKGVDNITLSVLKDYEKQLHKAEKALRGVQGKIARQQSDAAKDAARDAAKTAAQHAARDAAIAAAKEAAKDAAKNASKTASKDSSKDSGQSAAKSAAHPPPPAMHHPK